MTAEQLFAAVKSQCGVRHGKKQKAAFLQLFSAALAEAGVPCERQCRAGSCNLLIGDLTAADVIVTAHYDTPRQNVLNVPMYFDTPVRKALRYFPQTLVNLLCGVRRNPANVNDNTSGVLGVYELALGGMAGVLFDNEEKGDLGSEMFYRRRKDLRGKRYVNLDCIGAGSDYVVMYNRGEREFAERLASCADGSFPLRVERDTSASYYSDNKALDRAVTVAAFKKDGRGRLYVDDIHTKHDTALHFSNIRFVTDMILTFSRQLFTPSGIE